MREEAKLTLKFSSSGSGQMEGWFPAILQPNYKTTQRCAHSWGRGGGEGGVLVTRGKIDDVSVTRRAETHPGISTLLSAASKREERSRGHM